MIARVGDETIYVPVRIILVLYSKNEDGKNTTVEIIPRPERIVSGV
jgi:hypothetical protein